MTADPEAALSVIIPAFNEERRLPATLDAVLAFLAQEPYRSEIIVADDGSLDGTCGAVRKYMGRPIPVRLIMQPDGKNRGKGSAVRMGMLCATGRHRLFMDADNSTTIDHVRRFRREFDAGCEVVIGSRNMPGAHIAVHQPFYKEAAGRFGNLLIRRLAVPGIHDTQAGFKMFTARAAEEIFRRLTIMRWGYDVEVLAIASCLGYRIRELPITWANDPGSKVSWRAYLDVLSEVWRVRANLRRGAYR
jgi:dolichyl-phosphate beta-glucosyltransferase